MGRKNQQSIKNRVAIYTNLLDNGGISKFVYNLHEALKLEFVENLIITFQAETIYGEEITVLSCKSHLGRIFKLRQYIKQQRIATIVTNTWFETLIAKIATIGIFELKVFSVVHIRPNLWGFKQDDKFRKILSKLSLAHCDKVIAVSNELREAMITEGWIKSNQIITIYNPVIFDDNNIIPSGLKSKTLSEKNRVEVAIIGWIQPRKAQDIILKAMSQVQHQNFYLHFIGGYDDQAYYDYIHQLVLSLSLATRVKFWGPQKNVLTLLSEMDVLISASRGEALPTVMIEALYSEVPIISSDCNYGPKEILDNGTYGLIFRVDDDRALCECYERLVSDSNLYQRLVKQSKKRSELFTARNAARRYKELFEE